MTAPPLFWSWLASSLLRKCSTEGQQLLLLLISAVKRIVCWGTGLEKYLALVNRKPSKKKKILPCTYRPPCEEEGRECCRKIYLLNKSETCNLSLFSKYKFIIFYYFFLNISLYAFPRHSLKIFVAVLFFFFSPVLHMLVIQKKQ